MKRDPIDVKGLAAILFLILAVDLVIRPFSQTTGQSAQHYIPAALLDSALVLALTLPLAFVMTPPVREALVGRQGRGLWTLPFLLLFAFAGGGAVVRGELFLRYVSDEPVSRLVVYTLMLALAFYAMRCGLETLARVCGVLLWIFGISLVLLLWANAGAMQIQNLSIEPFSVREVLRTALRGFSMPAQIPLFFWFSLCATGRLEKPYARSVLLTVLTAVILSAAAELVLGMQAQTQNQTIHALSRLGRLSVFQRLDALHIAAWMMAEFAKVCAYGLGVRMAAESLLPERQREYASRWGLGVLAAGVAAAACLPDAWQNLLETCASVLLLGGSALCAVRLRRAYEKKKTG